MPQVYFRVLKTRGVYASYPAFRRVINDEFQNVIGPDLQQRHELTTAKWKVRPEFKATQKVTKDGVSVVVSPFGNAADIWRMHNAGVPGRTIRPNPSRRRARIAARKRKMGRSYKRDTRVIGRLRRPTALKFKGRGGNDVYRNTVEWKGIRAREYTAKIAKEYAPIFYRRMENAMRRGVTAAIREGK